MEIRLKDFQNQCSIFKYNVEVFLNKVAPVLNADPGSKSQLKEISAGADKLTNFLPGTTRS